MARLASIEKNNKRIALGKRYFAERARLREVVRSLTVSEEEKVEARRKLEKLPRNSATGRSITRCQLSGRPRGNYKKFGLSRIAFRKLALDGKLPGVTKASW